MALSVPIRRVGAGDGLPLPKAMTAGAAGYDLVAAITSPIRLEPGAFMRIPTGVAIALPEGYEGQVRPRSGLAAEHGVTVLNAPGTVDCDYRGELAVCLINHGPQRFVVERGMRIAQLVLARVERLEWLEVDTLPGTDRGTGGYGSTGT